MFPRRFCRRLPCQSARFPAILESTRSLAVTIPGGVFTVGTTPVEVAEAVNECIRDGGTCEASYAEDSFPAHEVMVDSYLFETTEVTFEQYVTFLNVRGPDTHINGCAGFPCIQTQNESLDAPITFDGANYSIGVGLSQHPVYGVTYYGALAYCEAVGRRLPTEAEWERAARADDDRIFPWGNRWDSALAKTNRPLDTPPGSFPVGSYPLGASIYGVYDMAGNVAEWVSGLVQRTLLSGAGRLGYVGQSHRPVGRSTESAARRLLERRAILQPRDASPIGISGRVISAGSVFRCAEDPPDTDAIGSSNLNPATLGVDVPAAPPQSTGVINAQPTLPSPPEANRSDDAGTSNSAG